MILYIDFKDSFNLKNQICSHWNSKFRNFTHPNIKARNVKFIFKFEIVALDGGSFLVVAQKLFGIIN